MESSYDYSYGTGGGEAMAAGVSLVIMVIYFAVIAVMLISMWKIFSKAGQPGWASIIPIYNVIVLLQVVGRPVWWFILMLIPFVNFVILVLISLDLAKVFGKGSGFGLGIAFLPYIFYPLLAFGSARYQGAAMPAAGAPAPTYAPPAPPTPAAAPAPPAPAAPPAPYEPPAPPAPPAPAAPYEPPTPPAPPAPPSE